jgi:hypothetical protein
MRKDICLSAFVIALFTMGAVCQGQNTFQEPVGGDPYAVEPPPLTVAQCGQCHPHIFRSIRNDGGRHRFPCQDCHEQFHAYSPVKKNWAELMPKCDQCHQQPHGEKITDCLKCHANPHTPKQVAMDSQLLSACKECHGKPNAELAEFPSAHTKQGCSACHQSHGRIPSCLDCHAPHVKNQAPSACLACHPAHKPLQVGYDVAADSATCGSCHTGALTSWQSTSSMHGKVNCAQCHPKHRQVPECSSCHGKPHDPGILTKFPRCLDCHIDAHDLPVNR